MKSITLAIPESAAAKLAELARRDYRAPRQQASVLLVEAIERAEAASAPAAQGAARSRRESRP